MYAIRIDQKEKVLSLIDILRTNPAESERIGLNLDSAAKIVILIEKTSGSEKNEVKSADGLSVPNFPSGESDHKRILDAVSVFFNANVLSAYSDKENPNLDRPTANDSR